MAVNTATNRSVEALQMPALLNQTDADDNDCVSPSVSGDSLDLNDIYAQARAKSRTATSMDDDFYCNETSSDEEEEDETKEVTGARDRSPGWATTKRVTDEVGEMDASTEDNFVVPSVSDDSMDLKYILAQSRIESRTAANMDDDFYCSDTMSSDDDACNDSRMQIARTLTEGLSPETGDKYESPKISATPDSGDRPRRPSILHISNILDQTDCPVGTPIPRESTKAEDTDSESDDDVHVLPSIYGASMDIGFISAKARVDSGTAISKDDDFCCNESACSDEETHGSGRCGKKMNKSVTFASSETVMEDSGARKSSVNRTVAPCSHRTPSPVVPGSHRNPSPVVPGSKTFEAFDPSSLIDSTDDDKNTVNTVSTEQIDGHAKSASLISSVKFSKADRVVEGAEDDEKRPFKSKATYVDGERFKNLFERIIDRSSVIPSASKNAMDALKNCRTDTPFLFTNDDNVYIESDEEAGDNGVENAFMSLERISDTTEDTARETISTARKKENSDSEDELAFTVSAEDEYAETALQAFYPAEPTEITLQGKIKEINDRAYSRIRTPCPLLDLLREHGDFEDELAFAVSEDKYAETALQAFYPAEPTEITLQGKIKEINDRAYSRMRTPYPLLDLLKEHGNKSPTMNSSSNFVLNMEDTDEKEELKTFQSPPSLPVEKKNKKKKRKDQKRMKEELKTVNRLSPTPLFTTPILGPIKSGQNNSQREYKQTSSHKSPSIDSFSDGIVLNTEIIEEKEELGTFGWLQSLPVEKKNKKKKGKGQKRKKDELKTVNRLSPTPLFTTPVLGPIKSSQTNPQRANRRIICHKSPILESSSDGVVQENTEEKEELGTFGWLQSLPVEKRNKKKKGKGQKRKKDELKTVNRLSPTPLFTTPVLGPIKSSQTNPQMANIQTSCHKPPSLVSSSDGFVLNTKHTEEKEELGTFEWLQSYSQPVEKNKKKKRKGQKRKKDELKTVIRLSPTPLFTTPVLGPIKSGQNNSQRANRQTSRYMGTTDNAETPIQIGKPIAAKVHEQEETILQNVMSKLGDNNEHIRQHHGEEVTTPVPGCLHTRSLTVAKFRAQFNRACILLPEIEEKQYNVQPGVGDHLLETINKRDKHRQEKLMEFKANIDKLNRKAISLFGRQNENEGKGSNSIVLYMGTTENDETPIQIGKPVAAEVYEKEETILQNAMSKLGDNNEHTRQHHGEEETTPVPGCLHTRSLTVAKFRAQFNRACILLPEIEEIQYNVQPEVGDHLLETINKRDKHRQEKLTEFKANIETLNRKTISLLGRQNENEEKGSNSIVLYMGTTDNDETPIQIGKPLGAKVCEKEETILQNVMSKLGDNNEHIRHIHTEEETTPVSECLQTRSLTVAKFRTQLNRTCIFLPEIGEKQYNVQPGVGDHLLETTNERDKHRQEKLLEFKANIEKINRKTISLLGRQNENEGKGSNSKEDHTESGNQRCQESHELKAFKEVPSEQKQVASGTYTNKNQIEFTPHAPSGPKPSFVRRRRRFKQLSADQQQALKSKIENNEILVPRAPSGRKSN